MWAKTRNAGESGFSPLNDEKPLGQARLMPHLASRSMSAILVTHERDTSVLGQWYSDTTHFFNFSLVGRPPSARGCFESMDGTYRPVGDIFFLPRGQRYLAKGGPGSHKTLFVEMHAEALATEGLELRVDHPPVLQACMNLPYDRLRSLLLRMAQEVSAPGFASAVLMEGLGITLLAETLRVLQRVRENAARKGGLSPWQLRAIEARVRDAETLPTLTELAELCSLSQRHLMRAFREETGQTVGSFVHCLMLERAKSLLRDTDMPVSQIAAKGGFNNAGAFSTAFRRSTGESPRTYRMNQRLR